MMEIWNHKNDLKYYIWHIKCILIKPGLCPKTNLAVIQTKSLMIELIIISKKLWWLYNKKLSSRRPIDNIPLLITNKSYKYFPTTLNDLIFSSFINYCSFILWFLTKIICHYLLSHGKRNMLPNNVI